MAETTATTTTATTSTSTQILTALEAGSGIDVVALARNLTDVTKMPQTQAIEAKIKASDASVSGYALIAQEMSSLKSAIETLNDADELAVSSGSSSAAGKVGFTAIAGNAVSGSYDVIVSQLAQSQRTISDQFSLSTTVLNATAFDISLSLGATVPGTYNETLSEPDLRAAVANGASITATDGAGNSISVSQSEINAAGSTSTGAETLAGYAAALQAKAASSAAFQFSAAVNGTSGVTFSQKTAGTGSLSSAQGAVTAGVSALSAVSGVTAKYNVTASASATTTLVVGDGKNTVTVGSAAYTSIAEQVAAIKAGSGYENLLFTVEANAAGNGFEFSYKTTGAISTAPTMTSSGGSHTVSSTRTGVTAINSPTVTSINVSTATPAGVVSAINAANTGVTAALVDTGTQGSNYRIMLTGAIGGQGVFSLSSNPDLGFGDSGNTLRSAEDAVLSVNGLALTRESNEISDVISGATFVLSEASATAVRLNVTNDQSTLKTNLQGVVTAYNKFNRLLADLTSSVANEDLSYSGDLAREQSAVRYIKQQVFDKLMAESSTKSGSISALRDVGISVDKTGNLTLTAATFDAAIANSYDDVATMLSAGTSNQSLYDTKAKGLAQDVATLIDGLNSSTGIIATRKDNAEDYSDDYAADLLVLEARMEKVYQRYLTQFAAMDSMLEKMDGTKNYLTGQLESLANMYNSD
ncbi:flagellar filament capping protein FliD [Porticoccaceae bacterium]|nr:flagellar filament capping protein FliD [Porticoccaceae bacterium]